MNDFEKAVRQVLSADGCIVIPVSSYNMLLKYVADRAMIDDCEMAKRVYKSAYFDSEKIISKTITQNVIDIYNRAS